VHQGRALSVALLPKLDLSEPGRNLVLAPDQINDPHNLGAILRSAAAFEVRRDHSERRSAELRGVVAKAASGARAGVPGGQSRPRAR
jgi:23S rRNA (guanosine2251-2'-O)-methyltransferase